jgi:RNA polymerase sigma factor (sigma-70 family)
MCTPAYAHLEYERLFISESSSVEEYETGTDPIEWSDDEIAAIRAVLQKLTALRITNSMDAEDLVQDTLLTMVAKCPGNELEKGLLVWSMGILRKKVGNYYRKAHRYTWLKEQEICIQRWNRQSMRTGSPEKRVAHEELQVIVEKTLAQLPPSQREAMELSIAGFEAGEIARQLHPERYQNVINHLYRARKRLARELAKYGYGPHARAGIIKKRLVRRS